MPLLDIVTAQPSFQNHLGAVRAQGLIHGKILGMLRFGNGKKLASLSKFPQIPKKVNLNLGHLEMVRGDFMIKAVATLEPKCSVENKDELKDSSYLQIGIETRIPENQHPSSSEDSTELDEREKLRRSRISKANKGNTPWNKGRKHSPETLQRIRERTRLAMQDPKVKMKLVNLGHAQSKETRVKIGIGVRLGWLRRREKLMLQETCYFEWQNLIAEASRKGYVGEEELQWDSYKILDEQLEQEWLESIEQRKIMRRPQGSKRAPKSPEQRRKISEAISAKWADPEYRQRVCSALANYHGTPVAVERKPKRQPTGSTKSSRRSPVRKMVSDPSNSSAIESNSETRVKKSRTPLYKDPLVSSKLEMIKNIRAQRAATEMKKNEAMEQAKLLIAEAEKAAKALEVAATWSPLARVSLMETRKLIDEAMQSIESVEKELMPFNTDEGYSLIGTGTEDLNEGTQKEVNGAETLESSQNRGNDFDFGKFTLQNLLNGEEKVLQTDCQDFGLPQLDLDGLVKRSVTAKQTGQFEPNGHINGQKTVAPDENRIQNKRKETASNSFAITKKWVRGRLVDVAECD